MPMFPELVMACRGCILVLAFLSKVLGIPIYCFHAHYVFLITRTFRRYPGLVLVTPGDDSQDGGDQRYWLL